MSMSNNVMSININNVSNTLIYNNNNFPLTNTITTYDEYFNNCLTDALLDNIFGFNEIPKKLIQEYLGTEMDLDEIKNILVANETTKNTKNYILFPHIINIIQEYLYIPMYVPVNLKKEQDILYGPWTEYDIDNHTIISDTIDSSVDYIMNELADQDCMEIINFDPETLEEDYQDRLYESVDNAVAFQINLYEYLELKNMSY